MANQKQAAQSQQSKPHTPAAQAAGGALAVPEWMKGKAGVGTEGLTSKDVEMPRLKLLQGISEELQIYDGVKAGQFFHTLAEEALPSSINIVPIYLSKRYVLWRPRPPVDQGGILARADDAVHWQPANTEFTVKIDKKGSTVKWLTANTVDESGLANWGTYDPGDPNSPPAATECHVILVALPEYPQYSPVALFLQRSAIKPARRLLGKLKMSTAPIYGCQFKMDSFIDHGESGDFNNYRFTANGFVQDPAQGAAYEAMYEQFKRTGVKVKLEDDEAPTGGNAADEKKF